MAAGELHEISAAIGGLQADMAGAARDRQAMWHELREMNARFERLMPVIDTVAEIKPQVASLMAARQQGAGALRLIFSIGSLVGAGAALKTAVDWFSNRGH